VIGRVRVNRLPLGDSVADLEQRVELFLERADDQHIDRGTITHRSMLHDRPSARPKLPRKPGRLLVLRTQLLGVKLGVVKQRCAGFDLGDPSSELGLPSRIESDRRERAG